MEAIEGRKRRKIRNEKKRLGTLNIKKETRKAL